jgi:hypothetical protein
VLRKDLTIQRFGEISAALSQKGANRAAVLRAHLLSEAAWTLVDQTWKKTIAAEATEGGHALAEAFDEAYVAQQERFDPPVDLAAYARLQVAVERGAVGQVLADLDLELGDLVRLQRVWERRAASSPELSAAVARSLDEARRSTRGAAPGEPGSPPEPAATVAAPPDEPSSAPEAPAPLGASPGEPSPAAESPSNAEPPAGEPGSAPVHDGGSAGYADSAGSAPKPPVHDGGTASSADSAGSAPKPPEPQATKEAPAGEPGSAPEPPATMEAPPSPRDQ